MQDDRWIGSPALLSPPGSGLDWCTAQCINFRIRIIVIRADSGLGERPAEKPPESRSVLLPRSSLLDCASGSGRPIRTIYPHGRWSLTRHTCCFDRLIPRRQILIAPLPASDRRRIFRNIRSGYSRWSMVRHHRANESPLRTRPFWSLKEPWPNPVYCHLHF